MQNMARTKGLSRTNVDGDCVLMIEHLDRLGAGNARARALALNHGPRKGETRDERHAN
jgi:hypothetical protein